MRPALEVQGLTVAYARKRRAPAVVVKDLDLRLDAGRMLGLAGESGCGKSTAALAALGFRIPGSIRLGGRALLGDVDLLSLKRHALRSIWGRRVAYVAQDAAQALTPFWRVGSLLAEPLKLHLGLRGRALHERACGLLESVGIPDPESALRRYPHQFSGGQQQRIALAIAIACEPEVLVLDEPTTGLDVTTQAQISALISGLVGQQGMAGLYISHDLALIATICDDIAIMYAGEVVESGAAPAIYAGARHPYAAALLDAVPQVDEDASVVGIPGLPPPQVIDDACAYAARCRFVIEQCREGHPPLLTVADGHEARCIRVHELGVIPSARLPLETPAAAPARTDVELAVERLRCSYAGRHGTVAVEDLSLEIAAGETLGLVGESGSGKSTLLRAIAGLHIPDEGRILFEGRPLAPTAVRRPRDVRRAIQIVFQHPDSSLNPRHSIARILERPLALFRPELGRRERRGVIHELLEDVRLDSGVLDRYPAELSGGQKQRIALARAFAAEPRLILCDEVVSALDVSVQASILELLARLAAERSTALLFVTHDLAVVRSIADRVTVMRAGRSCETAPTARLFTAPEHPYTRELLAAAPRPGSTPREGGRLEAASATSGDDNPP